MSAPSSASPASAAAPRASEPIAALTLEHYPGMAEAEIKRHADERDARAGRCTGLTVIHRFGRIMPGENIVLVVTASSHRQAAFEAARIPDGLSQDQRAVLEARGKRHAARAGSRRAATTTPPPRAGPNPDGQSAQSPRRTQAHPAAKAAQGRQPANCRRCSISSAMR